jgi:hypothetical protein
MKSGDHGNSHFAEEIAPAHQLRGIFFWLERKRSEQHRQAAKPTNSRESGLKRAMGGG